MVNQLFRLTKPKIAVFGKKDYQQQILIKKMSKERFPNLKILTGPIVRNNHGLALSSRNSYLNEKQKNRASYFFKSLLSGTEHYKKIQNINCVI